MKQYSNLDTEMEFRSLTKRENFRIKQTFLKLGKMFMIVIIAMFITSVANAQTEPYTQQAVEVQPIIMVTDTINSWEEVIKPLLGKKIYVDIWATWCKPCLMEFAYNEALKRILSENDIQQLYISLDNDPDSDNDKKWKDCIKQYNLTGTHIRFQMGGLALDIQKLFLTNAEGKVDISLPQYILIDEKGNIINKHAKRPSQLVAGEKLW